jgi:formate--tetrahydrofolate ligase
MGYNVAMLTDIEIAQSVKPLPISEIAARADIPERFVEQYGKSKAKIDLSFLEERKSRADAKLVLVTAITPTPAGEGKTTTTIGLADGLRRLGKKSVLALREPSMGPVFGVKGGAAGGGYSQVVPMEEINLHFTGDFHAIGAANNLLAAMIDNHIFQGNELGIDPKTIVWRRCVDMNDRQLRFVVDGLGGAKNGCPREDGYDITVASEVMAILCLSSSIADLKARLGRIIIGYRYDGTPVTAADLKAQGAMAAILKEALKPNLVQSLEGTPAFIHGGPFANIAHGCNSVLATKMALKCGDYVITEAGFGADLGAEKFMDIKCRTTGLRPSAVVVVATIRALKMHGGLKKDSLGTEDLGALDKGLPNLLRHVSVMTDVYKVPCVVAVNRFPTDTEAELDLVSRRCAELGVNAVLSEVWAKGGEGGKALAKEIVRLCDIPSAVELTYADDDPLETKISKIVTRIYGGSGVSYAAGVKTKIRKLEAMGFTNVPVCMAKTQYSFSDDPKKLCAPEGFTVSVRDVKASAGAGFVVVYTGEIMTMPGLPKVPQATVIDIDDSGKITGLM